MTNSKSLARKLFPRVLKAAIKATIVVVVFLVLLQFLAPLQEVVPWTKGLLETYFMVYVFFIVAAELVKGTIYQYGLNLGKAFFLIGYSIYAFNNGIITQTVQPITFTANLQLFLIMIILIEIIDFAKNLMQIINYLADKAETEAVTFAVVEQEIPA